MQRYYCIEFALNVAVKNLLSQWIFLMFCSVHNRLKIGLTKCKLCGNEPVILFYQTSKSLSWKLQQHFCMKEMKHCNNNIIAINLLLLPRVELFFHHNFVESCHFLINNICSKRWKWEKHIFEATLQTIS